MATLNGVAHEVVPLPANKRTLKSPYSMSVKAITLHNTYNDAAARSEISYMQSNNNAVSYHLAVDNFRAVQGLQFNRNGWHAGDGKNGYGNRNTIGVEICYSKSGGTRYDKSEDNAIKVTAALMVMFNLRMKDIKKHQDWSGKNCPHRILARSRGWQGILNEIEKEYNRLKGGNDEVSGGNYKVVKTLNAYSTAADAAARRNRRSTVSAGDYYVFNRSQGMVNVTSRSGVPGSWINPNDNVTASPKPTPNRRIRTGGLNEDNLVKVSNWLKDAKWYWTASGTSGNNPKITTGGLSAATHKRFSDWLEKEGLYYQTIN